MKGKKGGERESKPEQNEGGLMSWEVKKKLLKWVCLIPGEGEGGNNTEMR